MKIGAYQFAVTNDIKHNLEVIKKAVTKATHEGVKLLVFPECALTGYPPHDIESSSVVKFHELIIAYELLQNLVDENGICVIIGAITKEEDKYFSSAIVFTPHQGKMFYHKRALWGWDKDNFSTGNRNGIFEIDGWKVGVRICFEVRFPEFFRELYEAHTDLNIVLFYDVTDKDDIERYELIKSHIRTRAVENITYTLTVDTICPYQTAPTALYDKSGGSLIELKRNEEGLLMYDLEKREPNFGEKGRIEISDWLRGI